jgi:hypothetical protein
MTVTAKPLFNHTAWEGYLTIQNFENMMIRNTMRQKYREADREKK